MGIKQALSRIYWSTRTFNRLRGKHYFISPHAKIVIRGDGILTMGRDAYVSPQAVLTVYGKCTIGNDVYIGRNVTVVAMSDLSIGPGTRLAENVAIHTENHVGAWLDDYETRPVSIGEACWICAGAVVTSGVEIGKHTIVAANAVVTQDMPPWSLVGGVPARVIRRRPERRLLN